MRKEKQEEVQHNLKDLANGKSSKDCSPDEAWDVYRAYVGKSKTREERLRRINIFRCGW